MRVPNKWRKEVRDIKLQWRQKKKYGKKQVQVTLKVK
jgi:hypothetical protein